MSVTNTTSTLYNSNDSSSVYSRGHLKKVSSSGAFGRFNRSRSSSYASLEEEKDILQQSNSLFSRKRFGLKSSAKSAPVIPRVINNIEQEQEEQEEQEQEQEYIDENDDENVYFAKSSTCYNRHNLKRQASGSNNNWRSSMLRAVGVKSR